MFKKQKIIFVLFLSFLFLCFQKPILAAENNFSININPVRGIDSQNSPNNFILFQKEIGQRNNFPITWLIRPDYFLNNQNNLFIQPEYQNDDLGIFLEVTSTWANAVDIDYQNNLPWYHPQNIFLSGYNPSDRFKLIDYAMLEFKKVYGNYPKSVGAWHIDPVSAQYLVDKYQITSFLICSDQTSTDSYQIWGAWWGIPYYPSKNNLLIPANSESNKLNALVLFWAQRDPLNGYGQGTHSLYSLQANDYTKLNLNIDYFNKITNIYFDQTTSSFGQVTVGLENDDNFFLQKEYQNQINNLLSKSIFVTASFFSNWYFSHFPKLSPNTEIIGIDPLGSNQEFKWILKKDSRTFLTKDSNSDWETKDFRNYNNADIDPYKYYRNLENVLHWRLSSQFDSVFKINQGNPVFNNLRFFTIAFSVIITVILFMFLFKKINKIPALIIIIGTFLLSLTMMRSGLNYNFGIGFWGPNGHDGIWHLSLINQLQQSIPPKNPVFSSTFLTNYHWGFDLLAAFLGKIINNNSFVYFQFLPILLGLSIGFFAYKLIKQNLKNEVLAILFTFLIYFSGSFGWIYTLIKSGQLGGESLFWSMQSISTLINPPFALSLIFILIGLNFWTKNNQSNKYFLAILNGLIFGLLAAIKVYAGILVGLTLVVLWLIQLIKTKKIVNYTFITWLTTLFISLLLLILLGVLKNSSLLEFKPFWFIHSMVESIDKFYLPRVAAYRSSLSQNLSLIKIPLFLIIESILTLVFLIGNMGLRFLGFITIFQKIRNHKLSQLEKFFLILMLIAFAIPLFFIQKGTAWNTIQFFYYFIFFSNLFFAQLLSNLIKNKKIIIVCIILLLANITSYTTLKDYLGNPPPAAIPKKEVEALNFLKSQKQGIVLTYPYDRYIKNNLSTPVPIYTYETTAYVSAFSNQITFLEDEMNLDITGFDWQTRRQQEEKFFASTDKFFARGFLLNNQIDYIYLVNNQKFNLDEQDLQIEKIFDNGQVRLYQVQK